jgi:hypothetical protein
MPVTVLYDANVLYPNTLRDLLIRIAQSGMVQAKWTNAILDEMTAALRRNRPDIPTPTTGTYSQPQSRLAPRSSPPAISRTSRVRPRPWNIEAKSPDAFILDQVHIDIRAVAASVRQIADSRTNPPEAIEDVPSQLERDGLVESVTALRAA